MMKFMDKYEDVINNAFLTLISVLMMGTILMVCIAVIPGLGAEAIFMTIIMWFMSIIVIGYCGYGLLKAIEEVRSK